MTEDKQAKEKQAKNDQGLGAFLRSMREEKGISFDEMQRLTKIPVRSLHAIENDDYAALPADAFARGFYLLYARSLDLDPQEILQRYDGLRGGAPSGAPYSSPTQQGRQVNTMAARPSMTKGAFFGFGLVVLVALVAVLSWYFSWNPAAYISDQLQELQQDGGQEAPQEATVIEELGTVPPSRRNEPVGSNYFLTIDFRADTAITITIDGGLPEQELYTEGSTRSWYADESISLILPASAEVDLLFNGSQIPLPPPDNGVITLTLP